MLALFLVAREATSDLHLLLLEVIDPGTLDLGLLGRLVRTLVEAVPLGLPGVHRVFGLAQFEPGPVGYATGLVEQDWLASEFIPVVQQRGAAIIKARGASSAASAASAAIDHMHDWALGTPDGDWVSMAVPSDGSYGVPEGIVYSFPVRCQDGRSQIKNKEKALTILRSKLLEKKQREEAEKYSSQRRNLIGSGGREEKIRTYNFPQNRVTDHRINLTLYKLDEIIQGDLNQVIEPLINEYQAEQLASLSGE